MSHALQSFVAVLSLAAAAIAGGPAEAVSAAAADIAKQPAGVRQSLRYLGLYAVPQKERAEFLKVLAFHCNSLSRESEIVAPVLVAPDLVRVNLLDYSWSRSVWEKLAAHDPYFHVGLDGGRVVVPEPPAVKIPAVEEVPEVSIEGIQFFRELGGNRLQEVERGDLKPGETILVKKVRGGSLESVTVPTGVKRAEPKREQVKEKAPSPAHAPWLPGRDIAALALACNSDAPILRADWFLYWTAIENDRQGSGYYSFLGLGKKESDFQELVGVDVKLAKKVKKEMAASVGRSGVTLNNRGIEWYASITGDYYRTQDYKTSTFKQNTIRLLAGDTEPPAGDASEQYGTLPNGLFAFWLQNDKGERQDSAPDFIASDGSASGTDRRVHAGKSCIVCHSEGIRPVNDWVRRVYSGPLSLASPDYETLKRLRRLYLSDLEGQVKRSQRNYGEVLAKVNGLTSEANARAYGRVWDAYFETDLGVDDVCRELNVQPAAFLAALKAYASKGGADPILSGLLANPPERIRREHFEEVFSIAQTIVRTKP